MRRTTFGVNAVTVFSANTPAPPALRSSLPYNTRYSCTRTHTTAHSVSWERMCVWLVRDIDDEGDGE